MDLIYMGESEPLTPTCLTQSHCPTSALTLKIGCFELTCGMWAPQNAGTKHSGCRCPPPFATQKISLGVEDGAADEALAQTSLPQTLSPHRAAIEDSPAC